MTIPLEPFTPPKALASRLSRPIIASVVLQHVEEAAMLRLIRSSLVRAPHVQLLQLGQIDERIEAHLDGIRVAGDAGTALARAALDRVHVGSAFTVLVGAIEQRDLAQLTMQLSMLDTPPEIMRAAASAAGWVSPINLRGMMPAWFDAPEAVLQWFALVACAVHRADPGAALLRLMEHTDMRVRLRALQAAGELGRPDLRDACVDAMRELDPPPNGREHGLVYVEHKIRTILHANPEPALLAARAALLLGDRGAALAHVNTLALKLTSSQQTQAAALTMLFGDPDRGRALVSELSMRAATDPVQFRLLIKASGWSGDPQVVPWLIQQMAQPKVARLAGEAFTTITGVNLAKFDLENIDQPDAPPSGPNDHPGNDDVAIDEDDSLPWPNVDKVRTWWSREGSRFTPGVRHLMGEQVDGSSLLRVLDTGTQRIRSQAAYIRCAIAPGTPLFNISAPQRRQARLLKSMTSIE